MDPWNDHPRATLHAYLDGELSLEGSLAVEQHLTACESCRREQETLGALQRTLRSEKGGAPEPEPAPPRAARRVSRRTFALVGAVAIAATFVAVLLGPLSTRGRPRSRAPVDSMESTERRPSLLIVRPRWGKTQGDEQMRSLIRSLFLLSLSAAPLAFAGTPAKALAESTGAVSATATDSASAELDSRDVAMVRTQVLDLETTLKGMRRELAQIQEQEDARARVIGDPNDHPLWP